MMTYEVDAKEAAGNIIVKVQILNAKQWKVRLWVATKLIRLATKIAWLSLEINERPRTLH